MLERINKSAILPPDLENLGRGVLVTFSLSVLDEDLARIFEPGAPGPYERLQTLQQLKKLGFYVGIAFVPVLPYISDSEEDLSKMIAKAKEFGADYVFVGALTLFGVGKKIFMQIIEKHFPELVQRYEELYGVSYEPSREYQSRLDSIARKLCREYGVRYRII